MLDPSNIVQLPADLRLQDIVPLTVDINDIEVVPTIEMLAATNINSPQLYDFCVTLHSFKQAADFYEDMETPGGNLYIPNRRVDCSARRPMSRNTHYMLTPLEALALRNDPRVLAVELTIEEAGLVKRPYGSVKYIETGPFTKSGTANNDRNWGLVRCSERTHRIGWNENGNTTISDATITRYDTGKHVDLVITDGPVDPNHPEFAVNSDGTGGSRFVQYNWLQHTPEVSGGSEGTYTYDYVPDMHGTHVAGTAGGNRQGWAKEANIYSMDVFNGSTGTYPFDYVRAFHNNKPINPATGRKNPTVVNASWGYSLSAMLDVAHIAEINYRGAIYNAAGGANTLSAAVFYAGMVSFNGAYANTLAYNGLIVSSRNAGVDADLADAVAAGVIVVCAGGNNYDMADVPGGVDYDNSITMQSTAPFNASGTVYHHRGGSPGAAPAAICVGNLGATSILDGANSAAGDLGCIAVTSLRGARIDIWAPGTNIMSSTPANTAGAVADDRDSNFTQNALTGTSMASPQVAGYVACLVSQYPEYTTTDIKAHLANFATPDQIGNTTNGVWGGAPFGTPTGYPFDWLTDLQRAPNKIMYAIEAKPDTGVCKPIITYKDRPTTGVVYPRPRRKPVRK